MGIAHSSKNARERIVDEIASGGDNKLMIDHKHQISSEKQTIHNQASSHTPGILDVKGSSLLAESIVGRYLLSNERISILRELNTIKYSEAKLEKSIGTFSKSASLGHRGGISACQGYSAVVTDYADLNIFCNSTTTLLASSQISNASVVRGVYWLGQNHNNLAVLCEDGTLQFWDFIL